MQVRLQHNWYNGLTDFLRAHGIRTLLLVCGRSFDRSPVRARIEALPVKLIRFSDFRPNPLYEDVCKGVALFNDVGCDAIMAIGGGSSIDVAKCIKLYCRMDPHRNYLYQKPKDTELPLIALPTTAGTGSESTHFAVIYYNGEKQSVTHDSILPGVAILEPAVLDALPPHQKKSAMLDALCQAIESWWSVNSTEESITYANKAIGLIWNNRRTYINGGNAADKIMLGANYAGRAINITKTTAPHAMSYKLTSLYHLPHGHAVAICLPEVWSYMLSHMNDCEDRRGAQYLEGVFVDIAIAMGYESPQEAIIRLQDYLTELQMERPTGTDAALLASSVNATRLRNNPVRLDHAALRCIYERILRS